MTTFLCRGRSTASLIRAWYIRGGNASARMLFRDHAGADNSGGVSRKTSPIEVERMPPGNSSNVNGRISGIG